MYKIKNGILEENGKKIFAVGEFVLPVVLSLQISRSAGGRQSRRDEKGFCYDEKPWF